MASLCNFTGGSLFSKSLYLPFTRVPPSPSSVSCSKPAPESVEDGDGGDVELEASQTKRISKQSSWEAKDALGRDYLYRLGQEADNMNIAVGARAGVIDDLFTGNFLGKDCTASLPYSKFRLMIVDFIQKLSLLSRFSSSVDLACWIILRSSASQSSRPCSLWLRPWCCHSGVSQQRVKWLDKRKYLTFPKLIFVFLGNSWRKASRVF